MSKTKKYLWRSLVIIGALCILNLPFTVRAQEGSSLEDLSELTATVNIQVSWNKHDEYNGNLEKTGSMSTSVTGTLTLDKQQKGMFLFFPGSEGMNAEVKYQNVTRDKKTGEIHLKEEGSGSVQVLSPRSITDPQTQGHFEFMACTGPAGRALALQLSGQIDIDSLREAMTSQENMDHYTFSVATPVQTVVTDKDGNSEEGLRGIHFALVAEALKGGAISNSLSWTAEKIKYSIGHQNFMGTVYDPPKSGDVNYIVSWTFGEVPSDVEIQREVNGKWVDITDETVQVVVGEKMKLRGVVVPEEKDPKKGTWTIDGERNTSEGAVENYIKRYKAHFLTGGRVIPLQDLNTQELEFYWVDGGAGKVKYITRPGGQEISAEAHFEIRKPNYKVAIGASKETEIKEPKKGAELDPEECWGAGAHGAAGENELWLQYKGINFKAENLDKGEIDGKEQWVQIIKIHDSFQKYSDDNRVSSLIEDALDHCYPYQSGPKARDAPAIPLEKKGKPLEVTREDGTIIELRATGATQANRMYLMFKPDGKESEWVPIKVVVWKWTGNVEYDSSTAGWQKFNCSIDPAEPKAEDTAEYPKWDKNSGDNSKYTIK
jgi:hypothetical protein